MDDATRRLAALLAPLTNYERTRPDAVRWSLENMQSLLASPAVPTPRAKLIQIGGSKGKGTTALYVESLARAAGMRVGVYQSPHLESILERVRIDGAPITEAKLRAAIEPVLAAATSGGLKISFFEAMTAAAVSCFAAADVDLAVLEVGLGGRLDATTAVPVDASILTGVELEHTEILGETIPAIAAEKAWVCRAGRPAFTAARPPALAVVRAHALRVGAALSVLGEDFSCELDDEHAEVLRGTWTPPRGVPQPFSLLGAALFEVPAFALAATCLTALWPELSVPLDPAPRPALPGRCEVISWAGGPLVLDGAHTRESLRALGTEIERRFPGQRCAVLFACARGKAWRESLRSLLPLSDKFLVTGLTGTATAEPAEIRQWLASQGMTAEVVAGAAPGLLALRSHTGPRIVTGSFYLVGEVRAHIARTEGAW